MCRTSKRHPGHPTPGVPLALCHPLLALLPLPALPPNLLCNCLSYSHALCGPGPAQFVSPTALAPFISSLPTTLTARLPSCVTPMPRSNCPFSSPPFLSCLPLNCLSLMPASQLLHSFPHPALFARLGGRRHHALLPFPPAVHNIKPAPGAAVLSFHYSHHLWLLPSPSAHLVP